jgi:hypothetical protein
MTLGGGKQVFQIVGDTFDLKVNEINQILIGKMIKKFIY